MRTNYDPFNREEELEQERLDAAREDQILWSLEQSRKGQSAAQRENVGVWIKPPVPPDIQPQEPRS